MAKTIHRNKYRAMKKGLKGLHKTFSGTTKKCQNKLS